jgi:acetyl-CoA C-acetyltransferase
MVCGSGMQAIINGINEIRCGKDLILCGGVEFMSNIPYATNSYIRLGKKFGDFTMTDLMTHDGLIDSFSGVHMGITAENIAREYHISREEQDEFSYFTQQRTISAVDSGKFIEEIVPVTLKDYRGKEFVFSEDEFPNRSSTLEKLSSLKPSFLKDGTGTVTAGNSSGINDGAAFVLLASEKYVKENNIEPLCEIVMGTSAACDPQMMGLGPYYAISNMLDKTNVSIRDIDYFEINEAFAAQTLGVYKLLTDKYQLEDGYIKNRCNIYGSGLGLGHPLGATGARITTTLSYILKNKNAKYGIASLCIGGGMGTALLLKRG